METVHGIQYIKPQVILLQETGIGTSEIAARTCYDSFDNSENEVIKLVNACQPSNLPMAAALANDIPHSDLLDTLAWTHFHHSILEHANLTYLIKGMSRGALQEQARHRIQGISVRSTRYTMSSVINAFVASTSYVYTKDEAKDKAKLWFIDEVSNLDLLITTCKEYNKLEISNMYDKLFYQMNTLGIQEFLKIAVAKSSLPMVSSNVGSPRNTFEELQAGKKKRNVGDAFKHIITDNFKTDLVVTFNLRSLKNYLTLRDSGAAFFQIRWVAEAIKAATPSKYLDLIVKG